MGSLGVSFAISLLSLLFQLWEMCKSQASGRVVQD